MEFTIYDTTLSITNQNGHKEHYGLFHRVLNALSDLEFQVGEHPYCASYPSLKKDHRYGIRKSLEFRAERYPVGFKITFFQNVNITNPNGGAYDFEKFEKMPYLMKKELLLLFEKLRKMLLDLNLTEIPVDSSTLAVDRIKADYVSSWHKPQKSMDFDLSDLDGTTEEIYNSTDRDGKILRCGQIKYFRDSNGYLSRGKIYHNINNMWWVIVNKTSLRNLADFQLFDLTEDDVRGRLAENRMPSNKKDFLNQIHDYPTKELIKELKRRNIKVKEERKTL